MIRRIRHLLKALSYLDPETEIPFDVPWEELKVDVVRAQTRNRVNRHRGRGNAVATQSTAGGNDVTQNVTQIVTQKGALDEVVSFHANIFPNARDTKRARACVAKVLKELSQEDVIEAIRGCKSSNWHVEHGQTRLSWICKDTEQVAFFRQKWQTRHLQNLSEVTKANLRTLQEGNHAGPDEDRPGIGSDGDGVWPSFGRPPEGVVDRGDGGAGL